MSKMPVLWFWTLVLTWVVVVATIEQGFDRIHALNGYAESRITGFEQFEQEIVTPSEVNVDGYPLVHNRYKRNIEFPKKKHISFNGFGEFFDLELDSSFHLLAPGFKVYRLGSTSGEISENGQDLDECLFRGTLKNHSDSMAALNLCGGMSGILKKGSVDYLIEPVNRNSSDIMALEKPHVLRKRSILNPGQDKTDKKKQKFFCGNRRRYMPHMPRRKDHWLPDEFSVAGNNSSTAPVRAKRWTKRGRRQRRRSVETLVVADREMVRKHGTENVTSYLLTVFNMVAMLYQDSTIGNNVSVILVGLVLLEGDEPGLTLSHNAETSLSSFCQWQSTVHTTRGKQHDHAVLVTGLDICSWKDEPCDTLGYAPISGMCSKYRSCTVNEDSGLALAFTVAHEIGHNFGMVHDGQGSSPCRRKRGTIMSASLSGLDSSLLWSDCSRRDLTNFLESARSLCLKNEPYSPDELQFPNHLPGQLYDADMQCRLQFGTKSKLCEHYPRKKEVCRALWCQRNGRECETKFLPAAEGTPCGKSKWCRKGLCVSSEPDPQRVTNGGWGLFSKWSNCSRPCGGGLMVRERLCDSPPPSNGGSYCKGEEHEYRICETQDCRSDSLEYINDQCATFNKRTVKGKFYRWKPYGKDLGALSRCRIYCVPDKEDLYLVLSTKLQDGTSCSGNFSGVCIDGECRNVGCDGKIESSVTPDICGVCNGDNSTCRTVKGSFNTSNLTTGYHEVIRIPSDSRSINVSESREYPTYLALQDDKGRYHLNENWILDWPGRYSAAGTMFSYRRWPGQPESLVAKGPTTEDLLVEVFLQEKVEAVINYEFVISSIQARWKMKNSSCSVTCGNGTFLSSPVCVTSTGQVTKNIYCNISKIPSIKSYYCAQEPCSPLWYMGDWSPCNTEDCEPRQQIRDVFCIEQGEKVASFNCDNQIRPIHVRECSRNKCLYRWHTGPWSKCRGICNSGFQTRSVTCRRSINETAESFSNCHKDAQPSHSRKCKSNCSLDEKQNPSVWVTGSWSECSVECGEGEEERNVTCIKKYGDSGHPSSTCDPNLKPLSKQICTKANCSILKNADCADLYKWCPTSTNERLCELKFYATNCCISCRKKL